MVDNGVRKNAKGVDVQVGEYEILTWASPENPIGHYRGIEAFCNMQPVMNDVVIRLTDWDGMMTHIRIDRDGARRLMAQIRLALKGQSP